MNDFELHVFHEGKWYDDTCNDMWPYWTVIRVDGGWRYDLRERGTAVAASLAEAKTAVEADYTLWRKAGL